jgi:hypothetical protein
MIDSQCNVQTAICVQYRVGATAAQAGSYKETPILKNTKLDIEAQASISYTDIEGAFVDIDKFLISGYNDIDVLIFDINISLILNCVNIEVPRFQVNINDLLIFYWINKRD